LLFEAQPKAGKMIAAASQSERDAVAGRLARVKVDTTSIARLEKVAGEYNSRELGPLVVRRKDGQYRGEFGSWSNFPLAACRQLSPPWPALLRGEVRVGLVILSVLCSISSQSPKLPAVPASCANRAVNSRANQTYSLMQ
jgi:hypothetical protein